MKIKRIIAIAFGLCIVPCIILVMAFQYPKFAERRSQLQSVEERRVARKAKQLEKYQMAEQDFDKFMELQKQVILKRVISDSDLESLLNYAKPTSAFAVHVNVLGTLSFLENVPAAQKEKIRLALLPYIKEDDPRYRSLIRAILDKVFDIYDWKPGQIPPRQSGN